MNKTSAKIRSVKISIDQAGDEYLEGLYIDGISGWVDPFVVDGIDTPEDMNQDEVILWAKEQVGKNLLYTELKQSNFYTVGKTYIV